MKKTIIYFLGLTIFAFACNNNTPASELKAKLDENKKTIKDLKTENSIIEKKLKALNADKDSIKHRIPVETQTLMLETFNHFIEVNGVLKAEESAIIIPEVSGQIKNVYVEDGDRVKKGQLLFLLNNETIYNQIKQTEASLELANTVFTRLKNLWGQQIGSEVEFLKAKSDKESLESALASQKAQLDLFSIEAPFSGIVDNITVKKGEIAAPGNPIAQVVNLKNMNIKTDVSEVYLPFINSGDTAEVSFYTFPDMVIDCIIKHTGNIIHPDNRTFNVEVSVENSSEKLKPNMMARLLINDFTQENALIVPSAIIKNDIKGKFLFIEEDGLAKKMYVETGKSYMDNTLIVGGLNKNNKVIVNGYNTVSNNAPVEVR